MTQIYKSHWRSGNRPDLQCDDRRHQPGTPRRAPGFRYRVLRSLAPSDEVWREQQTDAFEAAYIDQLEAIGAEAILAGLARIAGDRAAVLLCWEKPGADYCHRWTLSRWLREQIGVEVPELEAGMLPQRPDVAERRLF